MDHQEQPPLKRKRQMSDCQDRPRTCNDYTVGWICALFEEQVAATAMLDHIHDGDLSKPQNDPNTYTLGSISHNQIVIACLPNGKFGNNPAGTCANQMVRTFPFIRVVLMVGIGGGVPPKVKLGDVVISNPVDQFSGVIQWDLGKTEKDGKFKPIGALNNPPTALLTAVSKMRARTRINGHKIPRYLEEMGERFPRLVPQYTQSTSLIDPLSRDVPDQAEKAAGHLETTHVHYGLIASGNQVIKDANLRDKIDQNFNGHVLCIEMEAAALMDNFPCIVIRGICDYADSMKNKSWQPYAAAVAAACAKELLQYVQPSDVYAERPVKNVLGDVIRVIRSTETQVKSMRSQLDREEDLRILDWLNKTDYGPRHSDILRRRQPGTGQWFLDSAQYQDWRSLERQTLFCKGIPGSGKTMIAAIVIDNLNTTFLQDQSIGLAYLYCAFDRQVEQTVENLLASLIKQLCKGQPSLPGEVKELFHKHKRHNTLPSLDELSKTLLAVTSMHKKVFIVVDALDECQASDGRLRQLLSEIFALQSKAKISFLATSRPLPEIENQFTACIMQTISASEEDIRSYIAGHMDRLPEFVIEDPALQEEIKVKIIEAAIGMFLIVRLYLESLVGLQAPRAIRTALRKLPHGSDAYDYAYTEAMQRIKSQAPAYQQAAEKALIWITSAKRQLKISELQHALAVEDGDTELDESGIPQVTYILSVCAGLVTVDEESDTMRLVHYTTQEYFDRTRLHWFPHAESEITSTCIRYLSFHTFCVPCQIETALSQRVQTYKLYDYAARHWGHHARVALTLCPKVRLFLEDNALIESSSQVLFQDILQTKTRGIHVAAFFGLEQPIRAIPQSTNEIDPRDSCGRTPLSIAAQEGHDTVACLLLDKGANIESKDSNSYRTPLFHAVAEGHQTMVQLLLQRGAKPDPKDVQDMTPLSCASFKGHTEIGRILLNAGAKTESNNGYSISPLTRPSLKDRDEFSWFASESIQRALLFNEDLTDSRSPLSNAAYEGHETLVQLLLDEGAEINAKDIINMTPLALAAEQGHEGVVRILLKKGPELESKDSAIWRTALAHAAAEGHRTIVQMLLNSGADTETKDIDGLTPLSLALSEGGDDDMIQVLLENGASWDTGHDVGTTALEWAVLSSRDEMVQLLLERGADIDQKDRFGNTALAVAAGEGLETMVRILLDQGADLRSRNFLGETPLDRAVRHGNDSVVQLLLDRGADQALKDDMNQSLLFAASSSGHMTFARSCLQKGAQIDGKDFLGNTPLAIAASGGHNALVKLLLENGANLESKDSLGNTPLANAASSGHASLVKLLVENGANTESKNRDGKTPLAQAAESGRASVVELLLEKGANLESKDKDGWTPLVWATQRNRASVVKLLLGKDADVEAKDKNGTTPLAQAVRRGNDGGMAALLDHRVVKLLLEHGAQVESKDRDGRTPLAYAAESGWASAVKLFLEKGADMESKDKDGRTPIALACAARWENTQVVGLLLEMGANMESKDDAGTTPLIWAARRGYTQIVKLMLEKGANREARDEDGMTALAWAGEEEHSAVARLLL